jgi:hypothetical protein
MNVWAMVDNFTFKEIDLKKEMIEGLRTRKNTQQSEGCA